MEKILCPNGMRILLEPSESAKTATIAVFIRAGSRYETLDQWGLAHFVEHMLFKGTPRRTAQQLAEETDMIGGQSNAYTTKEYTCVYIRALSEYDADALDLVGDIVVNPLISPEDVEIERGVILEEISMYEDSPEDLAGDGIYEAVWGNDPLGRTIIGLPESIKSATVEKIRQFHQSFYRPDQMVLAVSGKFDRQRILEKADELFCTLSGSANFSPPGPPVWQPGGLWIRKKDTQQVHLVLGYPSPSIEDNLNVPLAVLNSIVGGGASSRLFQRIREELGLAYSIYSYQVNHAGAGCYSISAGISPDNQEAALTEILKVLNILSSEGVSQPEFLRAKNQVRAGIAMSYENTYNLAMGIGRREIYGLPYKSEDSLLAELEAVTHEDVNGILNLLKGPVCLSVAGQTGEEQLYQSFMQ